MSPRRAGVGHRGRSSAQPFSLTEQFFLLQHRPDAVGPRFQIHWDPDAGTVAAGPLVFNAALLAERWRRHGAPLMMDWENGRARRPGGAGSVRARRPRPPCAVQRARAAFVAV